MSKGRLGLLKIILLHRTYFDLEVFEVLALKDCLLVTRLLAGKSSVSSLTFISKKESKFLSYESDLYAPKFAQIKH